MEMKLATDCWLEAEDVLNKIEPKKICNFGVKILDDALIGILPNDFMVLMADSGVGKSELAIEIAIHNASNGKVVALYFIEGGAEEAINRIRWKMICNKYFSEKQPETLDMDYRKWRMGLLKGELMSKLNLQCYKEFQNKVKKNLHIYCFEEGFTITMLINSLGWFTEQKRGDFLLENYLNIDLLVIDHLQYFTLANPKNELTEMTEILMKVKDITNHHKIPVLMVSHLRKKEKDRGLPSQEDAYGTSNIVKIASQAIAISPYFTSDNYSMEKYPTFFRFVKSRTGLRSSIAALCNFNFKIGKYEDEYLIYKLKGDKPEAEPLKPYDYPKWAKKGI